MTLEQALPLVPTVSFIEGLIYLIDEVNEDECEAGNFSTDGKFETTALVTLLQKLDLYTAGAKGYLDLLCE